MDTSYAVGRAMGPVAPGPHRVEDPPQPALRERAEFGPRFGDGSTVRAAALVARAGV